MDSTNLLGTSGSTMTENHQKLVEQYRENEKNRDKFTKKTISIEACVVVIVCTMKTLQGSATLNLNLIATTCVAFLTIWHFWGFKYRRFLDRQKTEIILDGVELEQRNPFSKLSFFRDYMKEFNIIGKLVHLAIFDVIFLYFFSVSVTQLLKAIDPEIITKLAPSTSIRTFIISVCLGLAYYPPIRPLAQLKKELERSWV